MARLQTTVSSEVNGRTVAAAARSGVTVADWLRAVIEAALEEDEAFASGVEPPLHDERAARVQARMRQAPVGVLSAGHRMIRGVGGR